MTGPRRGAHALKGRPPERSVPPPAPTWPCTTARSCGWWRTARRSGSRPHRAGGPRALAFELLEAIDRFDPDRCSRFEAPVPLRGASTSCVPRLGPPHRPSALPRAERVRAELASTAADRDRARGRRRPGPHMLHRGGPGTQRRAVTRGGAARPHPRLRRARSGGRPSGTRGQSGCCSARSRSSVTATGWCCGCTTGDRTPPTATAPGQQSRVSQCTAGAAARLRVRLAGGLPDESGPAPVTPPPRHEHKRIEVAALLAPHAPVTSAPTRHRGRDENGSRRDRRPPRDDAATGS